MEIKPAGPERNKQIAVLRGEDKPIYDEQAQTWYIPDKDYRKIEHAFELWEKMKAAGFTITLDSHKTGESECFVNDRPGVEYTDETEADAISGAWLILEGEK
jgi:hypothetical protein